MTDAELAAARLIELLDTCRENTALRVEVAHLRGERAAVVAWLREEYDTHTTQDAADTIERGEHRREEGA
jgi:hypothetical protein